MIVVADSSPVNYLVLIDEIDVLAHLFGAVIIPGAVASELGSDDAPDIVRKWIDDAPNWVRVAEVDESELTALDESQLHLGELEALAPARRLHADFLILDEKAARRVAEKHRLTVIGTLGVLEKADEEGLLGDFPTVLERLDDTNFYMGRSLKDLLLQRHRVRHRLES